MTYLPKTIITRELTFVKLFQGKLAFFLIPDKQKSCNIYILLSRRRYGGK
jgi:hypothetical protein